VVAGAPAAVNTGVVWLNKQASQYWINGHRVPADVSAFSTAKEGTIVPTKYKTPKELLRMLNTAAMDGIGTTVGAVVDAMAGADLSGERPVASFTVLDGENAYDKGTPNDFVKIVQSGPLGAVAARQDPANVVKPVYASVNGAVQCNACGFNGALAQEFVGESAAACMNPQEGAGACTLEGVQVLGADGQAGLLPSWAVQAGKLYDTEVGALTGLLDSQVVTGTLRLGCSGAAGDKACVAPAEVEEAIKAALGSDCARVNVQAHDQNKLHPALAVLGEGVLSTVNADDALAAAKLEGSERTEAFDVAFTTHTPECTAHVTEWLQGFQAEQLVAPLGAKGVQQAAADYSSTYTAKGMDAMQAAQAVLPAVVSAMRAGAVPGVLVSAADGAGAARMALPSLEKGDDAVVALTGFMPGKPVAFEVTAKCMALGSQDEAVPLGQFTPTEKGAVNVPFTVPTDLPKGTYSVRAVQNGLGFCSQPFQVPA
jgi:hypothetical protein